MRILVAPDAFKGSLTAPEAAAAMARGVRGAIPSADPIELPVADGGEGTVDVLVRATGGTFRTSRVTGPLGTPVGAVWGVLGDGRTAVIESAAAAGLGLVSADRRDLRAATTRGVGELVRAALDAGFRRIVVGAGGTGTNDGGAGAARALGARFLDVAGAEIGEGGAALARLASIDLDSIDLRLGSAEIAVACDVDSPLVGPLGATAVYGPQKGATPEIVAELDAALGHFARAAAAATGIDAATLPSGGAAGGLAAGLVLFGGARLCRGVEIVLDRIGFDGALAGVALVLTGEGRTDGQSARGKAPAGVAAAARRRGVPVVCISGALGDGADELDVDALATIAPGPIGSAECIERAAELLESATFRVCRMLRAGSTMRP
jgi:glycerate kinase